MLKRFQPQPKPHGVDRRVTCLKALRLFLFSRKPVQRIGSDRDLEEFVQVL